MATLFRSLFAALLLLVPAAGLADTVTVFAAASLREALDAAARDFERRTANRVVVSYGASNALARQIGSGARADLFISADVDWADDVKARDPAASRRDLLANELVLIAPAASNVSLRIAPGFPLAAALGDRRLALADPQAVPAGKYARAALEKLHVWSTVREKVAGAENVRAALAWVARGEAPLGIVYKTDALAEPHVRIVDTFPAGTHPPIVYPLLVLSRATPAARALAAELGSPADRATWQRFGFKPLP